MRRQQTADAVHRQVVVTDRSLRSLVLAFCLLLLAGAARAQNSAWLSVTAQVRPSVLFSGAAPDGSAFTQGGDQQAAATISLPTAPEQTFTTRAVVANNPLSHGYELRARLASSGSATVVLDGVTVSTTDTLISRHNRYGVTQSHSVAMSGAGDIRIVMTCTPD